MARKKTITREQILKAAYEVVATEGFSRFTARNIANKMKCSTQPIYLEFKNMDDLKESLFEEIQMHLMKEVFPVERNEDPIVNLALNYIHFSNEEKKLYRALYLEEYGLGDYLYKFSAEYFFTTIQQDDCYRTLSQEKMEGLHTGCWIVATGIASLMSSGIIQPTDEEIEVIMKKTIANII